MPAGELLLAPTRIYVKTVLAALREHPVHAIAHVTGGGLAANLARVLPTGMFARIDRSTWTPPALFQTVGALGQVPRSDLERTLNMGVGFVAVLPEAQADRAIEVSEASGIRAWRLGEVTVEERASIADGIEVVRGAKGVDGGAVQVVGEHR